METQPDYGLRNAEETTQPTTDQGHVIKVQENEVDMSEREVNGEKRSQSECDERLGKGKWRRREGIKRSLRDTAPVMKNMMKTGILKTNQRSAKVR